MRERERERERENYRQSENIGTVSKTTWGECLRDCVERILMDFFERRDTILNLQELLENFLL